jgi:integrase
MGRPMKIRLKYVHEYRDAKGRVWRYVRRKGMPNANLPGLPGSPEFMKAYQDALAAKPEPQIPQKAGSIGNLVARFYSSVEFKNLRGRSPRTYRLVLDRFALKDGHRTVRGLTRPLARKIIEEIGIETPSMANLTKSILHTLFEYAISLDMRDDNPFTRIRRYKGGTHHTWTDAELDGYRARWPLGTRERLAFAVLLYSGQRVSDAVKLKRSDVLSFSQQKTGKEMNIPAHPALIRAVKAGPSNGVYIVGDERGRPIIGDTLSKIIKRAVRQAKMPARCKAHGLRKAIQRVLAEHEATTKQMQAISGHKTLKEAERYSEAASQSRLAASAIARLPDER